MAFLQAFIDDSASETGNHRLVMAGYLNTTSKWALFADAWDEELRAAPAVEYLKMSEANSLRGQFRGWNDDTRDEKLRGFVRVARHFRPISFEVSISRHSYYELVRPASPRGISPHFVCTFGVVTAVTRYLTSIGAKTPVDFIFDEQLGVSADIALFFDYMKMSLPRSARTLINGNPIFRDDKKMLPLQAADMLAWHLRREQELGDAGRLPMAEKLRGNSHLVMEISDESLQDWAREFSTVPGVNLVQSKTQWQAVRRNISDLNAGGFVPPYGNRVRNLIYGARDALIGLFRR
ncbi:MAG: DUF3800 domain-containing protein [Kiloniellaceae bacterium]